MSSPVSAFSLPDPTVTLIVVNSIIRGPRAGLGNVAGTHGGIWLAPARAR